MNTSLLESIAERDQELKAGFTQGRTPDSFDEQKYLINHMEDEGHALYQEFDQLINKECSLTGRHFEVPSDQDEPVVYRSKTLSRPRRGYRTNSK